MVAGNSDGGELTPSAYYQKLDEWGTLREKIPKSRRKYTITDHMRINDNLHWNNHVETLANIKNK